MNYPFVSGKLPFGWSNVGEYWPRRLLHIPTMTSFERDESNVYNGVERPEYCILTYTWGRWEIRNEKGGPALDVLGTTWKIPPVKEEHFTVEKFQRVVQQMGKQFKWAWIDIACIDQENAEAQAEEVGRQASIFKNARQVFVWLSRLSTEVLTTAVGVIQEHGLELRGYLDHHHPQEWLGRQDDDNNDSHESSFTAPSLPHYRLIESLHKEFNIIFSDPWFSSLWTLQEVVLRNDAVALSKDAEPIWWDPDHHLYLTMFINHCQNMLQDFERLARELDAAETSARLLEPRDKEMRHRISNIEQLILQAGFYYLFSDNPNVQYGTARYRTTHREVDRIYAIMQIYNIRVGKAVRPKENPTLEELVDEFALAINQRCPIMGQMFVHTKRPAPGKSWRITENSNVPDCLMLSVERKPQSTIALNTSGAITATGKCCGFPEVLRMIRGVGFGFQLALDEHIPQGLSLFQATGIANRYVNGNIPGWPLVAQVGGQNLWVLLLGQVRAPWSVKQKRYSRRYITLLLNRVQWSEVKEWENVPCERIGLCTWVAREDWEEEITAKLPWREVELELR